MLDAYGQLERSMDQVAATAEQNGLTPEILELNLKSIIRPQ
jgi:hypothetical protein